MTYGAANLRIELRAGVANQTAVGLEPGTPIEPFAVGTEGSWQVQAIGMAPVHAYLYFDGDTLFISSPDPSAPAWLDGTQVFDDWTAVPPGSEVAMGAARFAVCSDSAVDERDRNPAPKPVPQRRRAPPRPLPPDEATVIQPMLEHPAQDSLGAQRFGGDPGDELPEPLARRKPRRIRQSAHSFVTKDDEATRFSPLDAGPRTAAQVAPPASLPVTRASAPSAGVPPWGAGPSGPPMPGGPPMPAGPPVPAAGLMPGARPRPGSAASWVPASVHPSAIGSGPPSPGAIPTTAGGALQPGAGAPNKRTAFDVIKSSWANASIPQKLILMLMPFAFGAVFVIFDDSPNTGSARGGPAGARSAATVASLEPDASTADAEYPAEASSVEAAPGPPASEARQGPASPPPAKTTPTGAGGRSLQRTAADAVAAGAYGEALELYEQLAKEHPDVKAYEEAARILRSKVKEQR